MSYLNPVDRFVISCLILDLIGYALIRVAASTPRTKGPSWRMDIVVGAVSTFALVVLFWDRGYVVGFKHVVLEKVKVPTPAPNKHIPPGTVATLAPWVWRGLALFTSNVIAIHALKVMINKAF